jgi:hypothetical protein
MHTRDTDLIPIIELGNQNNISETYQKKKNPGATTAAGLIKNYGFQLTTTPENLTHEQLLKKPDLAMKWQDVYFRWADEEEHKDAFNDQLKKNKQLNNLIGELVNLGINQTVAFFHKKMDVNIQAKDEYFFQGNFFRVVTIDNGWVYYTRFERNEKEQVTDIKMDGCE